MISELYKLPASIVLYWLGCVAYLALELRDSERWAGFWYPIYNWLMVQSSDLDVNGRYWKPASRD